VQEEFMKTHRPWQPHVSNDPLFNPFVPPTERTVTLEHIEIAEEEEEEEEEGSVPPESSAEQADDPPAK
jgi:hypothetical protein